MTFLSDPVNMEYIKINGESQAPQQMLLSLVTLIQLFFFGLWKHQRVDLFFKLLNM